MRIRLSIKRFHPEIDREPQFQEYFLEIRPDLTVLELLIQLKEEEEGGLAFRYSCRSSICGSCAMRINGSEKLACQTSVREEYEKYESLRIEPLANSAVIKDLVVDMKPFWEKVTEITPWLHPNSKSGTGKAKGVFTQEAYQALHNVDACILCGACVSSCNSLEVSGGFVGPAALAKAYRFIADPRESDQEKKERLEALILPDGIWDCVRCNFCVEVCPKDVKPMEAIVRLRREAIKAGMADSPGGRHITAFVEIVKKEGRLNEAQQPMRMLWKSPRLLLQAMPVGLRMGLKGKLPFLWHLPIKGIKQIRQIFKSRGYK